MTKSEERPAGPRFMRRIERMGTFLLLALLLAGAALQVRAQTAEVDPPDRAARLSEVVGQVWLYSPESDEWLGVGRNRPLTTGDRLATSNDARAEITLGSTTLRLDAATELEIVLLDDSRFSLHLHRGSVAARVRSAQALPEFEMNTDEGRFRLQVVGRYRFDRFEQVSDLTVMSGQAVFEGRNSALTVYTGQHAQFWLDAGGAPQYTMVQSVRDAFASWNDDRDSAEDRHAASRYVSPEMTGAEDLDRYGRWEQTTDYGPVWQPAVVPAGWAPYSTGHWAWIRPWGWTWVDDAPWGFAPFHYGRWVYHRNAWCWAPGSYVRRPVYAPALVAWMGGSRGSVSVSFGGPAVGWFPLGPREVYVPSYRTSSRYVRNLNRTHVTNDGVIDNYWRNRDEAGRRDFSNRKFPHAVTVVPQSVLTGRQPVAPFAGRLRSDPQVRAMLSDGRSLGVSVEAPVGRQVETRRAEIRPRPPFEGRAPGDLAGRPDGGRLEGRPDGGRSDGWRSERGWSDRSRDDRSRDDRSRDDRPGVRTGERPDDRPGERAGERPGERGSASRGIGGREPALSDPPGQTRGMASPAPFRRGSPADDGAGRPGFSARERRAPPEGANGDARLATRPGAPIAAPGGILREVVRPSAMEPGRPVAQPRGNDSPRATEPPRAVEPPAPAPPRTADGQRPAPPAAAREPRMSRPEPVERSEGRSGGRGGGERMR